VPSSTEDYAQFWPCGFHMLTQSLLSWVVISHLWVICVLSGLQHYHVMCKKPGAAKAWGWSGTFKWAPSPRRKPGAVCVSLRLDI
jgi:hypothetical protein